MRSHRHLLPRQKLEGNFAQPDTKMDEYPIQWNWRKAEKDERMGGQGRVERREKTRKILGSKRNCASLWFCPFLSSCASSLTSCSDLKADKIIYHRGTWVHANFNEDLQTIEKEISPSLLFYLRKKWINFPHLK